MSTVNFDTDAAIQRMRAQGMPEAQAREFVRLMWEAQRELVTKSDLREAITEVKMWTGKALAAQAGIIIAVMALLKVFA